MKSLSVRTILAHTALWAAYFVLLIFWFSLPFTFEAAVSHALRMLFVHMAIFYVNTRVLLPMFIEKNSWGLYILAIILAMGLTYFYFKLTNEFLTFERFEGREPRPRGPRRVILRESRYIVQNMLLCLGVFFVSTLNFMIQNSRNRKEDAMNREKEQLKTEMKLLRSQINPHFMFNALNNIYALSLQKNDNTPQAIMQLSEMMRYVLYESNVEYVPVKREWKYIENYIDIQLLKFENTVNITREELISGDPNITPMLLLPFVENAFKHGNIETDSDATILVKLSVENDTLEFDVFNSLPTGGKSKDAEGGIGLINVKRRLEYFYPDRHTLEIKETADSFNVSLTLSLS